IELTASQSHPALSPAGATAFGVEVAGVEQLVIVQEVERTRRHDALDEAIVALRQKVAEIHELPVHAVVLIRPGSLPRTCSGKVQRRACRQAFLGGTLEELARWEAPILSSRDPTPETTSSHALDD